MLVAYFSPLALVVVLLLSAFILSIIVPRLPDQWQARREIRYFIAPGLVGLAGLFLLTTRFTFGLDASGEGLQPLSAWNFFAESSGAELNIRADELALPFLLLTLLLLLVAALVSIPLVNGGGQGRGLVLGASVCFLFISADGLTQSYAILVFDILVALYWLNRGHANLSVARLFLGIFTASALALTGSLTPVGNVGPGVFLLGLGLWLRLGLYSFIEATVEESRRGTTSQPEAESSHGQLVYWGLSLAVGIYLFIRTLAGPLPEFVRWLAVITMLLNGLLVWLTESRAETSPKLAGSCSILIRLMLTQALPILLLVGPLIKNVATFFVVAAYALGLILSLAALWVTPRLGRPRLAEGAWSWPYLPALTATFTLIGLPFFLNWSAWAMIYPTFLSENVVIAVLVILAEVFALSGLVRYWLLLWRDNGDQSLNANPRARLISSRFISSRLISSAAGIVSMVPFLIPGLAPFILSAIARTELPPVDLTPSIATLVPIVAIIVGAVGLEYFRTQIIAWLKISPFAWAEFVRLRWLLFWGDKSLSRASKLALRVNVILEGQHYMGWVLFTALVGTLIIILIQVAT
jgi:hypothetical protein